MGEAQWGAVMGSPCNEMRHCMTVNDYAYFDTVAEISQKAPKMKILPSDEPWLPHWTGDGAIT